MKSAARRIITGEWGNEPIWRYETAEERLMAELERRNNGILKKIAYDLD